MGTVLQERKVHNGHNNLIYHNNRAKNKTTGHASSRRNTAVPSQVPEKEDCLAIDNGLQISRRQTASDKTSVMGTATALENTPKSKSQVSSVARPRERRHKRSPKCIGEKNVKEDSDDLRKVPSALLLSAKNAEPVENETQSKGQFKALESVSEITDNDSDLSDSEKIPGPSSIPSSLPVPPDLHLRAEVIDPRDFQLSRPPPRGRSRSRDTYPDFLPPPFNSWSLQHLATYLNTEGRVTPRPKPVGQLERYLERLLQLEWRQIQTIQEETGVPGVSTRCCRHRSHAAPHSSLSAPKSILQCQRAFPLALLSSLANVPPLQSPICTCPMCWNRYSACNGACRLNAQPHHSHLSPLLEKREKVHGVSRRSSSESRAQVGHRPGHRSHRLSDPLDGGSYLKRMQAIGNIRNPTACGQQTGVEAQTSRRKGPGGRSQSCGDVRDNGGRKARAERRTAMQHLKEESKSSGATSSDDLHSSNDSVASRTAMTQKRVEFVMQ